MSKVDMFLIGGLVLAAVVYQILERVPSDALNVALGVMCGIGASIPISFGLLVALTRQRHKSEVTVEWREPEPEPARVVRQSSPHQVPQQPSPQPQIIVIAPPQGQFAQGQFPQGFQIPAQWLNQTQPAPFMHEHAHAVDAREWRIFGEE